VSSTAGVPPSGAAIEVSQTFKSPCGNSVASTVCTTAPSKEYLTVLGVNSHPIVWNPALRSGVVIVLVE